MKESGDVSENGSVGGRSSSHSETSSQAEANKFLNKRNQNANEAEEDDLLEQSRTFQEAIFHSMYILVRARVTEHWKLAVGKLVLELLIPFLVVFNPSGGWPIDTSNPVWLVVRWALPRVPILKIWDYNTYIVIFYLLVGLIYAVLVAVAVLTLAMRRQEHSRWLRKFGSLLQLVTDTLFSVLFAAVLDFLVFFFDCDFGEKQRNHKFWIDKNCMDGDYIIHLCVAGTTTIVYFAASMTLLVASCELNPVAKGLLACPAAVTRVKILAFKAALVIAACTLDSVPRIQAIVMLVAVGYISWLSFSKLPFLRPYVNEAWTGGWIGVSYTVVLNAAWKFQYKHIDPRDGHSYMKKVLYGILPSVLVGAVLTECWWRWRMRAVRKFRDLAPNVKLKKVHKFSTPENVELLSRGMRKFDIDGLVVEEMVQLGETIIKCGMAVFPGDVGLLILTANYLMEVKRDGPAARTQLQLALKGGPSVIQRYQIFSTIENSKRLKDGQEGQLDLQSYVEFKRNYRAVIRLHKEALSAQRDYWQLLMRSQVKTGAIRSALEAMDQAADAAQQVYRRVLERYPNNGKLLRCYGKFLEDVQNNPAAAGRVYMEAARNGGADGLLSLDLKIQGADKPEFLTSMDLHEDACVVINAEGKILMVNACVSTLLGYSKADLEGANVSVLMPQPFSGRHSSYLSRYVQGGQPRILDTVRDVVALHKERYVMPLRLCVTKLSGIGTDAVFLGLLRPEPLDIRNTRAWVAPNGVILCTDPQFSSLTGLINDDMVGRSFQSLVADAMEADSLLELCKEATYETLTSGTIVRHMDLLHKYLPPVPVEVRVTIGGTDMQRIFVLNAQRVHDTAEGLMVVDHRGALTFATWDLAAMLGYSLKSFLKMKLEQLLPQPFSTMHGRFLRDQPITLPPVSCRAGSVVHFVNSNGANVHVRLKITAKDDDRGGHLHHVVQVSKVDVSSHEAMYGDKRLQLFCSMDGKILLVDCPNSSIFGFLASELVGSSLADCIDVFNDWRAHAGAEQLELFLWSLLDKEEEMPGTSWQVKVLSHSHDEEGLILPNINRKAPARLSAIHSRGISACLQAELIDLSEMDSESSLLLTMGKQAGDGIDGASGATLHTSVAGGKPGLRRVSAAGVRRGSMPGATIGGSGGAGAPAAAAASSWARITLWRRSLLSGVLELDESLVIRKADVNTGLITGHPPSMLPRMPLSGLIDIPRGVSWDELMHRGRMKKSALKGGASAVVSPMRRLLGKLPDGGTIALSLQGVAGVSATGRIIATIHPDSSFPGKPGNIFRALGLEATISRRKKVAATDAGGGQRNKSNERRGREEQQQQQQEEENEEEGGNSSEDALLAEGKQSKQKGSKKKGEFVSEQAIRLRGSDGDHGDASADHEGGLPREGVGLPFGRKTRSRIPTAREGDQDSGGDAGGDGSNDGGEPDGSSVAASFVGSAQISSGRSNDRDQDDMEEEAQEDMGKEEEEEEDEDGVGRRRRGSSSGTQKHRGHYYKGGEVDAAGMAGQPHLHRDARSHPDFIAMWARWLSRAMTAALAAQAHRLLEHKEAEEGSVGSGNGQLGDALHVVYAGPNRPASRERGAGGATLSTTAAHNNNNFCKQGNSGTAALSLPAEGPAEDPLEAYDGHLTSRHHHSRSSASTDRGAEAPSRGLQRGGPRQADSAEAAPGETQPIQRPLALPLQTEADAPSAAAAPTAAAAAAMEMHTKAGKKGKKGKGPKGTGKRKSSPRLRFKDSKDDEEDGDDGDDGGSGGGGGASQKKTGNHRRDHDNDDGGGDGGGAGGNSVEASLIGWRAVRIQAGTAHGRRRGDVEGRMLRFADAARGDSPRRREGSPPQRRSSAAVQQAAEAEAEGEGEEDDGDDDEAYQEIKRRASMVETNKMLAAAAEGFNPLKARGGAEKHKANGRDKAFGRGGGGGDGGSNASGGGGRGGGGMSVNDAASSQADDDDTASKGPGSSAFSDSSSMADADAAAADPRRARLLKRITKLVAGPGLAEVLSRLKSRVLLLLAAMLITHITCYIILFGLIKGQFSYVRGVHQLALAADRTQVAVARSAVIEFCSRPGVAPVGVCEMPLEAVVNDVRHALDDLESYHQAIYLGTSSGHGSPIMGRELFRLWTNPVYDYRLFLDVANARWMNRTLGLFQLGNHFIAAGRELLYWAPHNKGNISHLRSFQFLQVNGPWSLFQAYTVSLDYLSEEALGHISRLQLWVLVLLVVEAAVVQCSCVTFQWLMIWRMEKERRGTLLIGLSLPAPIMRILANRPLAVMEDSDGEEEDGKRRGEENGDVEDGGGGGSVRSGGSGGGSGGGRINRALSAGDARGGTKMTYGRQDAQSSAVASGGGLQRMPSERVAGVEELLGKFGIGGGGGDSGSGNGRSTGSIAATKNNGLMIQNQGWGVSVNGKFLGPSAANLLKFMIPLALWQVALGGILSVSYSDLHRMEQPLVILNMASRVIYRYSRLRMVAFLLVAAASPTQRAEWRAILLNEIGNLQSEYETLMYGGMAKTQEGSVFQYEVPASTFESSTIARDFFQQKRCFRWDQSQCYTPASPYYAVTHHGLDVMLRRILSEMILLAKDDDVDAVYNGTRYTTMYRVGVRDLYEGLHTSASLFQSVMLDRYQSIKLLHIVMLIITILLIVSYMALILRPYLASVAREAHCLAGLLSHVPAECDVLAHTRQVLKAHAKFLTPSRRRHRSGKGDMKAGGTNRQGSALLILGGRAGSGRKGVAGAGDVFSEERLSRRGSGTSFRTIVRQGSGLSTASAGDVSAAGGKRTGIGMGKGGVAALTKGRV